MGAFGWQDASQVREHATQFSGLAELVPIMPQPHKSPAPLLAFHAHAPGCEPHAWCPPEQTAGRLLHDEVDTTLGQHPTQHYHCPGNAVGSAHICAARVAEWLLSRSSCVAPCDPHKCAARDTEPHHASGGHGQGNLHSNSDADGIIISLRFIGWPVKSNRHPIGGI